MIYDSTLNITWLKDANYAQTSGYDADGHMEWGEAITWADQLEFGGYNDWRLWSVNESCWGYCNNSELGHLFYVDGGLKPGDSIATSATLTSLFDNLQWGYWSGTEAREFGSPYAWNFDGRTGYQSPNDKSSSDLYVWAVRDGDVAVVPLPAAGWLFGSALAGLAGGAIRRRRRLE